MSEREVIQIDSDSEEDEDLRRAIALSLQDTEALIPKEHAQPEPETEPEPAQDKVTFGALQLDRKKMEEERLQRLGKRPRGVSETEAQAPPAKRVQPGDSKPNLQYPEGTVKRTWASGYPRTGDDITIEEVFKPQELQLAVLSSFQWDDEWLLKKLDIRKTKVLLLASAPDEQTQREMNENAPANVRFCFPPMNGFGAMHSKLQLLKHANSLRIVVPTGNLVSYDWGETGIMENMVFLIDLPRLDDKQQFESTDFSENLKLFLKLSGVDTNMISSLCNYNFSKTRDMAFVYTKPGGHTGDDLERTGYPGLATAVKSLGLATAAPVDVDLVCSSLGSINNDFMAAIYGACQGIEGKSEYNERAGRKAGQTPQKRLNEFQDRLRVYFPKDETVAKSRGGRNAGGTICIQSKWWRSPTFPKHLFRDCVNNRDGLLMHSKVMYVRHSSKEDSDPKEAKGWAYIGSANLSESAWGRITKDRTKGTKLTCRNWECGVVLPIRAAKSAEGLDMFRGKLPIPMKIPASRYGKAEEPWFFQER